MPPARAATVLTTRAGLYHTAATVTVPPEKTALLIVIQALTAAFTTIHARKTRAASAGSAPKHARRIMFPARLAHSAAAVFASTTFAVP